MNDRINPLAQAYELAREHGFVIAKKPECINPTAILDRIYVDVYIVYRNRVRIGRRRDPAALLRLIKQALLTAQPLKAP